MGEGGVGGGPARCARQTSKDQEAGAQEIGEESEYPNAESRDQEASG
jgi:hypothetical protein